MLKVHRKIKHSFAARFSSSLLLLVGLIFSITFIVSFVFSNRMVESKMERNANMTLRLLNQEIENVLGQVEGTPDNLKHIVFSNWLESNDLYRLTVIALENNPFIYGSAIAFEPDYFPEQGYYFSPYSWRIRDSIYTKQLGKDDYHYFDMEWYATPKKLNASYWSNSYYDKEGGNAQMITYSSPITDTTGRFTGVFTADLSLEWLNELVKSKIPMEGVQIVIMDRNNVVLASQEDTQLLNSGLYSQSEKAFIYHTHTPQTEWTIFLSIPRKIMYEELFEAKIILLSIGITGLLLIFIFSIHVIKRFLKPLKHFSISAKQIAHGQLDTTLPEIKTEDEIAELNQSFRYMQAELLQYIENLKITTAEKERIDSEIRVARKLQLGMLPKVFPDEIDLYAILNPAKFVSGDLYDFFIREQKLYFILGDVAGKGLPAALLMAVTLNMFRTISSYVTPISDIVALMNKVMVENNDQNMFITLFAGILDLQTGVLHYCNAGHDPSIIISNDVCYLPVYPNLPIGVMPDFAYQSQEIKLKHGETLLFYTDGVTEAENKEHELYGAPRLLDCIRNHKGTTAQSLVEAILNDVKSYVRDYEPSDDLTLLVIRRLPHQKTSVTRQITFENKVTEISALQKFTAEFCHENNINPKLSRQLHLALEEALSNIILYAYPKLEAGKIELMASLKNNELIFTFTDYGIPFDPTQQPPPDITSSIKERPIGGLGIFLVRQMMDEINYQHLENRNQLTLKKII